MKSLFLFKRQIGHLWDKVVTEQSRQINPHVMFKVWAVEPFLYS